MVKLGLKKTGGFEQMLAIDDPTINRIRRIFEKTGKTLHQEALLINI
ncbi:MAG: hypothetical protein L3J71_14810 [Victivallaceae bacterium]|nr:hypothetical protein [Victivallaceae bacterium]